MARLFSLTALATCLLGAMSAPIAHVQKNPSSDSSLIGSQHTGRGFVYRGSDKESACSGLEYSSDRPVVAVSATQLKAKAASSVCGMYVRVNRHDTPQRHYVFQVADICKDCDENSLGFTADALHQFTNSNSLKVDWEFVHADDIEEVPEKEEDEEKELDVAQEHKGDEDEEEDENDDEREAEDDKDEDEDEDKEKEEDKDEENDDDEDEDSKDEGSSSRGKTYRGRGTWFSDTMGSCGERFSQSDLIAALNEDQMGRQYGPGSKCDQKIRVTANGYPGKSVVVRIVDTCPYEYCDTGAVDLSRAAFQKFADLDVGVLDLEWSFV
ncbi:hypothetical protein BGZ94_004380 [Podila epigama]|nr:hypothetical protein BGZ94_004380 [Podila epigama]